MTDTDIRAALRDATGDLSTPPDLLDRVRAGGHRRVVRRRTVLAAGLATVAAGTTAAVLRPAGGQDDQPVASPLLDDPTRGDLRADIGFLAEVRAVWSRHLGGSLPVRGRPHVVWAGSTPGGFRAAVVTQRVRQRVASPIGQISFGLQGFVEENEQGLKVISLEEMLTQAAGSPAAVLGARRDLLMVLDDGRGIRCSPDFGYTAQGKVTRTYEDLPFDRHDGVAFRSVDPQTDRVEIGLLARRPDPTGSLSVGLANLSTLVAAVAAHNRLQPATGPDLRGTPRIARPLPGRERAWPADAEADQDPTWDLTGRAGYDDPYGYHYLPGVATWWIRGATADRRRFVVQTLELDDGRARLFLMVGTPEPVFLGFLDPAAALPIRVRLPGDQGFVVASRGATLRYRAGTGPWLPVTGDAALLPVAATDVEVDPKGSTSPTEIVSLVG